MRTMGAQRYRRRDRPQGDDLPRLRYAPFYVAVKERLLAGEIGDIINIQATEHVSYHHLAVSYIRGKWGNEEKCGAPMLLAKCCHDMDLIMWLKSGVAPRQVASFGSDFQFDPGKKPAGAGKRCLVDCGIEENCLYSAKKHYIDHPDRWSFYVWDCLEHLEKPTIEDKIQSLKTDNIHGRCVWDCEHTVVDHQSVAINFADGATATLNMIGGTAKAERNLHIIGTKGEIKGVFDDRCLRCAPSMAASGPRLARGSGGPRHRRRQKRHDRPPRRRRPAAGGGLCARAAGRTAVHLLHEHQRFPQWPSGCVSGGKIAQDWHGG